LRTTIVIPFHRNLPQLEQSLPAARRSMPEAEIIVAADGATEDCRPLAASCHARVVEVPGPSGPAVARNRAAELATGDVLVFVDADVVAAPTAIPGMCDLLASAPDVAAVFGAYDLTPPERNFMSQFKNLTHVRVHEVGNPEASTFWAGLGAVRTDVFRELGGFDERFRRPSIEDIELGNRIVAAGRRIRLDPRFRGTHLKRWTLRSCIVTDIQARGVPWTQLIHRTGTVANDLNTSVALRLSVVVAYLAVLALVATVVSPWALIAVAALLLLLVGLNLDYYRWFARQRGLLFALRVVPVHLVHHLCNGVSFVAGTVLHVAGRAGLKLPGALPASVWTRTNATSRS
jgi:cellulose synthase/poly-beta-1,6-N-acetylglucosamine synthase-like glycosyltransferase